MRTIHAAAEDIRQGRLSPVDLLDECLERIDHCEPRVRAWVLIDREGARETAKQRHDEVKRGQWRSPLHGIPLGIKDIIDVFDWPTAAGSKLWANSIARQDATAVKRLREAGAVLLGKTVTTQYASFDPPVTRNPWNLERTPGGSSSGSAAAVACGMCLGALGSQTGGSITRPASYCGVASMKPSFGHVSLHGVVPLAPSMDHVGPMARCVWDLAMLLETVAGPDNRDPECSAYPVHAYSESVEAVAYPPQIGRVRGLFESHASDMIMERMESVISRFREGGAEVSESILPTAFAEVPTRHRVVMAVEAAQFHEPRLRRHPEDYQPRIRSLLEEGLSCPAPEYARCKVHQRGLQETIADSFRSGQVLLVPATPGPAPEAETTGDPIFNSPWSYLGCPTVSLPIGLSAEGLPIAIQLVAQHFQEKTLLKAAAWCEKVLKVEMGTPRGVA